jgi:hypothetical protein
VHVGAGRRLRWFELPLYIFGNGTHVSFFPQLNELNLLFFLTSRPKYARGFDLKSPVQKEGKA